MSALDRVIPWEELCVQDFFNFSLRAEIFKFKVSQVGLSV